MSKFSLTAQLQLKAPSNTTQVVNQLRNELKRGATIDLNITGVDKAKKQLQGLTSQTKAATKQTDNLSVAITKAAKRYLAFAAAGRAISLVSKLGNAVEEAIKFETQMNRVSQVTGKSTAALKGLSNTITTLSTNLGVASSDLAEIGVILSQAGFKANDLNSALTALAKTQLAPTFTDIRKTAEGAIAIFNQFGQGARALESQLGAINAVAGSFAVESDDLIDAVRRTGGVFKTAGGNLEEFIALFTSVRATTRESAESIATGLRTILTRIQRPKTIAFLQQLGVELKNAEGNFVGGFEAVQRLGKAFQDLPAGSTQFIAIAEELGGFRQIGKVIPLIQQTALAREALNVAQEGGSSLDAAVASRQKTLAVEIAKTKEEFLALVRAFSEDSAFQGIVRTTLKMTQGFISLADAIRPLIPLLGALAVPTLLRGGIGLAAGIRGGLTRKNTGGKILGFNKGGYVPGAGNRDTVPAMLTPGEFVIKKSSVKSLGAGTLEAMNNNKFATGGIVSLNPFDEGEPNVTRSSTKVARTAVESKANKSTKELNDIITYAKDKKLLAGDLKQMFGGTKAKALPLNLVGASIGDAQVGQKTEDGIKKDFANSVNNRGGAIAKFFSAKGIKKISAADTEKLGIASVIGNAFEGILTTIGAPFNQKNKNSAAFDFQGGVGSNIAKTLKAEELAKNPTDAKRTLSTSELTKVGTKKYPNLLADQVIELDKKVQEEKINKQLAQIKSTYRTQKKLSQADASVARSLGLSVGATAKLRKDGRFGNVGFGLNAGGKSPDPKDTVPAMLTPGEFVINAKSARSIGYGNLRSMNSKGVQGFNKGGVVGVQKFANGGAVGGGLAGGAALLTPLIIALPLVTAYLDGLGESTEKTSLAQQEYNSTIKKNVGLTKTGVTALAGLVLGFIGTKKAIKEVNNGLKAFKKRLQDNANKASKKEKKEFKSQMRAGGLSKKDIKTTNRFAEQGVGDKGGRDFKAVRNASAGLKTELLQLANSLARTEAKTAANERVTRRELRQQEKLRKSATRKARALNILNQVELDNLRTIKRSRDVFKQAKNTTQRLSNEIRRVSVLGEKATFSLKTFNREMGRTGVRGLARRGAGGVQRGAGRIGGALKGLGRGGIAGLAVGGVIAASVAGQGINQVVSEDRQRRSEIATRRGDATQAAELAKGAKLAQDEAELFTLTGALTRLFEGDDARRARRSENANIGIQAGQAAVSVDVSRQIKERQEAQKAGKQVASLGTFASVGAKQIKAAANNIEKEFNSGAISEKERQKAAQELGAESARYGEIIGKEAQSREELDAILKDNETQYEEINIAMANAAKAAFTAAEALRQTAKAQFDALQLTATFQSANLAVSNFLAGIQTGADPLDSFIKTVETASKTIGIDASQSIEELRDSLKRDLAGTGLEAGVDRQADAALAANAFANSIGGRLGNLELSTEGAGQREQQVRNALFEGLGNSETDKAIKAQIDAVLSKTDFNALDLSKVIKEVQTKVGTLSTGLLDAAKLQKAHNAVMKGLYKQREALEAKAADAQIKAIDLQLEAAKIFEGAGGAKLTAGARSDARVAQFNQVGSLAGVSLASGSAGDIAATSQQIQARFFAQQNAANASQAAVAAGGRGVFAGPEGALRDDRPELQRAQQQLIQTTKQQIAIRQEELKVIKQKNAAEKSALDKLISGDVAGFIKQQQAAGAATALESGDASLARLFSPEALGAGFKELQKRGDADLTAAQTTLRSFGIDSVGSAGVLAEETPEIKALNAEIRNLAVTLGDQAQAQAEFAKSDLQINQATITIAKAEYRDNLAATAGNVQGKWMGGTVYASRGAFIPRGTDTVPAMLTPGEFVVNRKAVQSGNNLQVLRAMNSGAGSGASSAGAMSGGGQVGYYQFGGVVEAITSAFGGGVTGLLSAFGNFNQTVEKLSNLSLNVTIPDTNIRVSVDALNISGLREQIVSDVMDKVGRDISSTKIDSTGDLTMATSIMPKIG